MEGVFITGTDTGVGKTCIAAGIARSLKKKGVDVGIMKPFASANMKYSSEYKSEDVSKLANAAEAQDSDDDMNPFFSTYATAPYTSTLLTNSMPIDISVALRSYSKLVSRHDFMVVEGIGGILVPLTQTKSIADFVALIKLPVIVVIRSRLGMINHTLLTLRT